LEAYPKTEGINLPVDLIRSVAIVLVILLHASIEPNLSVDFMSPQGIALWWTSNAYRSIAITCVPMFVMLTGALLLRPEKTDEPLRVFFRKRWMRIGIPSIFWGIIYFIWQFTVRGQPVSADYIFKGVLTGPYYHFWFLYVLVGLYLLTPLLRVIVNYAKWSVIKYFLVLWFVGTALAPLFALYGDLSSPVLWFQQSLFLLTGLIGYYILGPYIRGFQWRRRTLAALLVVGSVSTALGTYAIVGTFGESYGLELLDAASLTAIPTSVALFLLLASIPYQNIERHKKTSSLLALISQNTLPIYLFHIIVLETLQNGYLGFKISVTTMAPVVAIPLVTAVTLLICLAILVPLKKVPYLDRILG
jgi:surface polysaccharide O-acyltransferase-like enzyme